jgi:hypothetical protein
MKSKKEHFQNVIEKSIPLLQKIHDIPLSWLGTCTAIKIGDVRLVLFAP